MFSDDTIPSPGSIIAEKYEVEQVLGKGGMGVVVAARHVQLGQRVAIKFMRGLAAEDPSATTRFLREARAAASLTTEHVTKVLDVGTLESGAPYMVMEYLAGQDLGQVLHAEGPMAVPDAVDALLQACEALAEAHAIGIVHRDLKPSNLFVSRRVDGTSFLKVLDFGISKTSALGAQSENLTATGFAVGSPGYMSPEQVRNAKSVDARSDVWSLGVILYELLTGTAPFASDTLGDTFAKIVSEDPEPIARRRPDIPAGLASAVTLCLERRVDRRVQSVVDLASRLAPFGPPGAGASVQRIVHIARTAGGSTSGPQETLAARTQTASFDSQSSGSSGSSGSSSSRGAPAWQRSSSAAAGLPRRSLVGWVLAVMGAALLVLLGAIGVRTLGSGRATADARGEAAPSGPAARPEETAPASSRPTSTPPASVATQEEAIDRGEVEAAAPPPANVQHGPQAPPTPGARTTERRRAPPAGPSDAGARKPSSSPYEEL